MIGAKVRVGRRQTVAAAVAIAVVVAAVLWLGGRDGGPPIDGTRYADRLSIGGGGRGEVIRAVEPFDGEVVAEVDQQANPPVYVVRFPTGDIDELIAIADALEEASDLEVNFVPAPTGRPLP